MRIIAGTAKGRRLESPPGLSTRPMTGRVREALFSSLAGAVPTADVLDLYAGTGSMGLEALSRGAATCVFVERDRRAIRALLANVASVDLGGEVMAEDVDHFLARTSGPYDLVFVDPPYSLPLASVAAVLAQLTSRLAEDAIVVLHRRTGGGVATVPDALREVDRRSYGHSELVRYMKGSDIEEHT